jgi:hypothetical protein
MRFKILDKNRYPLPGTNGRYIHLASIQHSLREFIYFLDQQTHKTDIEEITGGRMEAIDDDNLWNDLAMTLKEAGLDIMVHKDG